MFADFHTTPPPLPKMELPNAKTSNIQDIIRDIFRFETLQENTGFFYIVIKQKISTKEKRTHIYGPVYRLGKGSEIIGYQT
jgi:hypothetical protein